MINTKLNRSKVLSFFVSLFVVLNLTSCEGFFTDNGIDEKIRAAIEYANAPTSSFFITADATAGTITPVGKISYKPTDYQNIKFKLKPEYEFIGWNFRYEEIQSGEKYTREITNKNWWKDYIDITNEEISDPASNGEITITLQIQFKKPEENMLIEPICSLKPVIKTFTPAYELKGVSRESQISVEFNSKINQETIFFTQKELDNIHGITKTLKNNNNQIYGYEIGSSRYFKNIEIMMGNANIDINDCYGDFQYRDDINTLFISAKKAVEISGEVAEVKVRFTNGIQNTDGAYMAETTKTFCINKTTNQKAVIGLKYNDNTPLQLSTIDAFMEQEITFPQDSTLQFLYWDIDAADDASKEKITIYNDTDKEQTMKFCANSVILQSEGVKISAVYKKRPAVAANGFTPQDKNGGVEKNNGIEIVFDQEINLQSFKAGYKISCNGNDVKDNFLEPELDSTDAKKVIIQADPENMLEVDKDSTKKITVTIPASLYYSCTMDGTEYQILAGEDITYSYKINSNTYDKAMIEFSVETTKVSVTGIKSGKEYNTDDSFSLTINEIDGYKFVGWKKSNNAGNKIQITQSDINPSVWNFKISGQCGTESSPVIITADVRDRLKVEKIDPDKNTTQACDTGIAVYFNHAPSKQDCIDKISITCDGRDVKEDYFPVSGWGNIVEVEQDGKTYYKLSIPASTTNRIAVNGTATIELSVSKDLSYTDETDNKIISLSETKDYIYRYKINDETTAKVNLELDSTKTNGTLANSITGEYSIGKQIAVSFTPAADYEFLYWETDYNNISFADKNQKNTNIIINSANPGGTTKIWPKTVEKLKVTNVTISGSPDSNGAYAKDSIIEVEFNKAPSDKINLRNSIEMAIGTTDVYTNYIVSLDDTKLTFTPRTDNRIQINSIQNLNLKIMSDFYYENSDTSSIVPKIYMKEADTRTIKIGPQTNSKATVSVTVDDDSNSNPHGTIKDASGNTFGLGAKTYNLDESFTLNFTPSTGYEFIGWTVSGATSNVSLSSTTTTSTTVRIVDSQSETTTIKPVCAEKLKVTSFKVNSGDLDSNETYAKDSSYTITFNKAPSVSSNDIKDYVNIQIGTKSYADYFIMSLSGSTLTIQADSTNRLPITENKTLTISVKNSLYYTHTTAGNISLYADTNSTKSVRIGPATLQKANVLVTNGTSAAGTIKDDTTGNNFTSTTTDYSKDQTFTLRYDLNSAYEFINWTVTSSSGTTAANNVKLSSTTSPTTTVTIIGSATGTATITANVEPKLALSSVTVNGSTFSDTATTTYPKDSVIVLTFNKTIPTGLTLSDYITLSCGNITGVIDYYTITSSGTKITLTPKTRLGITSNETLNLTVRSSLYYNYTTSRKITLASSVTKAIPLKTETVSKATVQVTNGTSAAGTIKDASTGNNFTTTATAYSKDQTFTLNYDLNSAYEFINWTVTSSSGTTAANNVKLSSTTSPTTTVTIIGSSSGTATIKANVAPKLSLSSVTVNGSTFSDTVTTPYPKDSVIVLNFNKNIPTGLSLSEYILLSCGNIADVLSYYSITSSGTTITLSPKKRLGITSNETLNLTVRSSLYYNYTTSRKITLASSVTKAIPLKPETNGKAKILVASDATYGTNAGTIQNASGTAFTTAETQYNLDDKLTLKFVPNNDYEFVYWSITGTANTNATDNIYYGDVNKKNEILCSKELEVTIVASKDGTVTIRPYCRPKLKVSSMTVNGTTFSEATPYPKDSVIKVVFDNVIYSESGNINDYVDIYSGTKRLNEDFSISTDSKTLTITPVTRQIFDSTKLITLTIKKGLYYRYRVTLPDDTMEYHHFPLNSEYKKNITLNTTTNSKAKIQVINDTTEWGTIKDLTDTATDYNLDHVINAKFVPNDGYEFIRWEVTSGPADNVSIASPEDKTTTITVTKAATGTTVIKPYCIEKLKIEKILVNNVETDVSTLTSNVYQKDSMYAFIFNHKIVHTNSSGTDDAATYVANKSHIRHNGADIISDGYYGITFGDSKKQITFVPQSSKFIEVNGTGKVVISFDSNLTTVVSGTTTGGYAYEKQLSLETEFNKTITINSKSKQKFTIDNRIWVDNANKGANYTGAGTLVITPSPDENGYYYLDEEITFTFEPGSDYVFDKWANEASDNVLKFTPLNDYNGGQPANTYKCKFTKANASGTTSKFTIKPYVKSALKLKSITPSLATFDSKGNATYPTVVPCDTNIVCTFNKTIDSSTFVVDCWTESGNNNKGLEIYMLKNNNINQKLLLRGYYDMSVKDGVYTIKPKAELQTYLLSLSQTEFIVYLEFNYNNKTIKTTDSTPLVLSGCYPELKQNQMSDTSIKFAFKMNTDVSQTAPILTSESVIVDNSVYYNKKSQNRKLTPGQKIYNTDKVLEQPWSSSSAGKLTYDFKVITNQKWAQNTLNNMELEIRHIGTLNSSDEDIVAASNSNQLYKFTIPYNGAVAEDPNQTRYNGTLNLTKYGCAQKEVLEFCFIFYDCNYQQIRRYYYMYYGGFSSTVYDYQW